MGRFSTAAGRARLYMVELADRFFGCRHRRTTMPMTPRSDNPDPSATYIVCLECGRRLPYDLNAMTALKPRLFSFGRRKSANPEQATGRPTRP
jgi:hypothetical protein